MTKEDIHRDALRIGEEEASKVMRHLGNCRTPEQLDRVVSNLHLSFDKVFNERLAQSREKIDCRAGCSFCCYMKVDVYAWEVFPILDFMRRNFSKDQIAEVHAKAKSRKEKTQPMTAEQYEDARLPCPLLRDGKCSVYEARPLVCRRYHSVKVSFCEAGFNNPTVSGTIGEVEELRTTMAVMAVRAAEAFQEAGFDDTWYDLSAALNEALSNSKCQKRWRDGKKAFSKDAVAKQPVEQSAQMKLPQKPDKDGTDEGLLNGLVDPD
jgi:Fe-S-cluster containining protein